MFTSLARRGALRVALGFAAAVSAAALAACSGQAPTRTASAAPAASSPAAITSSAVSPLETAPSPTTAPRPTTTRPATTGGTTTVRQTPACASRDFAAPPITDEGAAGSLYYTVTITNHGATCRLAGRPILHYTGGNGQAITLPFVATNGGSKPRSVLVGHGRSVEMTLRTPDGYGGWSPDSPQCAHPGTYQGVSVAVGNGNVALRNFRLVVKCEGVTLWSYWAVV